jgi:hypothetical protein
MTDYRATALRWMCVVQSSRSVRRGLIRRIDNWLYGLNEAYPEYDAYRGRSRRILRAIVATAVVAAALVFVTLLIAVVTAIVRRPDGAAAPDAMRAAPQTMRFPPQTLRAAPDAVRAPPDAPHAAPAIVTGTSDTRHTQAIPSTFTAAAA